jgi:phenylacetyl-CoA:acceptor oxidoreductase subunit 2
MGQAMKNRPKAISDRAAPKQQRNWDWRAASNFIAGGAGGSLLLFTALADLAPGTARAAIFLGLALIGAGLTCVWFEIGRPWRALNVYRHFETSWMTREAVVAAVLFAAGGVALLTVWPLFVMLTGVLGLVFLYSQARILAANKGSPTWRHPRSIPLMIATGLAEGAGFLACVLAAFTSGINVGVLAGLMALLAIRALFWKVYLAAVEADGVPDAALKVLGGMDSGFMIFGHVFPGVVIVAALAGMPGSTVWMFAAGLAAVASGWFLKFTLVRRAAFTQGISVLHLPVRGRGAGGVEAKPGWVAASGAKP